MAKELLYRNIKALAKYRGIRMQDIEKGIYRTQGYLSRELKLSAEELHGIAEMLNVSMDDLMTKDFENEVGCMNLLTLARINVEHLKPFFEKDECIKALLTVINEVYG